MPGGCRSPATAACQFVSAAHPFRGADRPALCKPASLLATLLRGSHAWLCRRRHHGMTVSATCSMRTPKSTDAGPALLDRERAASAANLSTGQSIALPAGAIGDLRPRRKTPPHGQGGMHRGLPTPPCSPSFGSAAESEAAPNSADGLPKHAEVRPFAASTGFAGTVRPFDPSSADAQFNPFAGAFLRIENATGGPPRPPKLPPLPPKLPPLPPKVPEPPPKVPMQADALPAPALVTSAVSNRPLSRRHQPAAPETTPASPTRPRQDAAFAGTTGGDWDKIVVAEGPRAAEPHGAAAGTDDSAKIVVSGPANDAASRADDARPSRPEAKPRRGPIASLKRWLSRAGRRI